MTGVAGHQPQSGTASAPKNAGFSTDRGPLCRLVSQSKKGPAKPMPIRCAPGTSVAICAVFSALQYEIKPETVLDEMLVRDLAHKFWEEQRCKQRASHHL
jgi:hypothetical protein